ncbi:hypothetical protein [Mariniluteicoccus flavus]
MAQRMSPRQLVLAAVAALIGLYAVGNAYTWLDAMIAEGAGGYIVMSILAVIGSLAMVAAVPVNFLWRRQPRWARAVLPTVAGVGGVCAAVCLWFVAMIQACSQTCAPVDTWKMLPALLACGALAGLGPAWAALGFRGASRAGAVRWWVAAAILATAGFCVAMFSWVEVGIYPNN